MISSSVRLALSGAICLSAGAAASAQSICDIVFRPGIPDFDQKRQTGSGIYGLPNDGKMFCAPTSCIDHLAYMANHGYPSAVGELLPGPRTWQNASNYNNVGLYIESMGSYMSCDPITGTGGGYASDWLDYLSDHSPGNYVIAFGESFSTDTSIPDVVTHMAAMIQLGALVNLHIGWYQRFGSGSNAYWERVGGHVVALCGTANACSTSPTVLYRDPSSGDSKFSQSTFTTSVSLAHRVTDRFSWKDDSNVYTRTTWQLDAYTGDTKAFIGGYRALWPNFGLGIDTVVGTLKFHFPKSLNTIGGAPQSLHLNIAALGDGSVRGIELHPQNTRAIIAVAPGTGTPARLAEVGMADGSVRVIRTLDPNSGPLTLGPKGQIYICDGGVLKEINAADGSVAQSFPLPRAIDALVFDDTTGHILGLARADRRIDTFRSDRFATLSSHTLPTAVTFGLNPSIAINPASGKLWLISGDNGAAFELTLPAATGQASAVSKSLPGVTTPRSLQFTMKGDALVLDAGILKEFGIDATTGRFVRANRTGLDGQAYGGLFRLPRTRWAFDPATIDRYDSVNLEPPMEIASIPDCVPDFNHDGSVDDFDYFDFLNALFAEKAIADWNADGVLDDFDLFDFLNDFFGGC
ncbi:MAG: hypothetical protein JNM07_12420 [Phycisphaerae bacterium]|nr:hypothetical protein [Phycisphaerae bacterium]